MLIGFLENVLQALQSLKANKLRSLLTMLGIIIGISSVIAIITLGNTMTAVVADQMQSMGMNNIIVSIRDKDSHSGSAMQRNMDSVTAATKTPTDDDLFTADRIGKFEQLYPDQVAAISISETGEGGQIKAGRKYANIATQGVNAGYFKANRLDMVTGRTLNANDMLKNASIAVISDKAATNIFGNTNVVGQEIQVYQRDEIKSYKVVGIYKYVQSSMMVSSASEDEVSTTVYIPINLLKANSSTKNYNSFTIMTNTDVNSEDFTAKTKSYFEKFYTQNQEWEPFVFNLADAMTTATSMLSTLSLAVAVIAAIALLVGGIGVMNIMLVSVTERTHEIGVRKALGARNRQIRMQFIIEAVMVSLFGGIIGIIIGILVAVAGAAALGETARLSLDVILLSVGFSTLVGIFFGYYPANKASKLNPIDALRYE